MLVVVAWQGSLSFRGGRRRAVPFDDFLFYDPIFCFTPACRGHKWRWSGRGCVGESGDVWENQGDDGGVWLDRRRRDSPQLRHPATAGDSFARTRLSNQLIGCFGLLVALLGSLCVRAWQFVRSCVHSCFCLLLIRFGSNDRCTVSCHSPIAVAVSVQRWSRWHIGTVIRQHLPKPIQARGHRRSTPPRRRLFQQCRR